MKRRRSLFFILWMLFILYAVFTAPDGNEGYLTQLIQMDDPDPMLLMVFSFLGIYPLAFAAFLLGEDDDRVPVWPFVIGSFMLGAFALMPYFFLAGNGSDRKVRTPGWIIRVLRSKVLLLIMSLGTAALFLYGMTAGRPDEYGNAFRVSQFVHVMTIDFFVLTALSVYAIYWRERKYGRENQKHWTGCLPIIGMLAYLVRVRS
ncbi:MULTISPECIES: hypothetical protein [Halobacillus]|uniref:hypothetical protein n=1 Tax=Halobacillus TaxID=45667 RepID=UPI00136FFB29|nr:MULTISPECIES: hypothetical protein [Halobacillus]MYL30834.1 hypothetical protein [Halobacillus halophilus]MYL36359.1 hypothetical protein [Halobacillus litoralis]